MRVPATVLKQFALSGGQRGLELGDVFAMPALLVGQLRGELADHGAVGWHGCRDVGGRASGAGLGAELLDPRAQRGGSVEEVW